LGGVLTAGRFTAVPRWVREPAVGVHESAGDPHSVRILALGALAAAAVRYLVPAVQRFSLAEAAAACRALETRATVGMVVLKP
jgi:hypothetical protein